MMLEWIKKNKRVLLIIVAIFVLGSIATINVLSKDGLVEQQRRCCAVACGELGGLCRGWHQDTLQCEFDADVEGLSKVGVFKVSNEFKETWCFGE